MSDLPPSLAGSGSIQRDHAPQPDADWLAPFRNEGRHRAEISFLGIAFTAITVEAATASLQRDLKSFLDGAIRSSDWGPEDKNFDTILAEALRQSFDSRLYELAQYHPVILLGAPQ
jgi:hypothetical protein